MTVLAAIRPDAVNLALFVHVLGAMLLVGVVLTAATAITAGRSVGGDGELRLTRFGLRTMLLASLPAFLLMRVGAQWVEAEENLPEVIEDDAWLGIGYAVGDLGALLVIVSMVLSWLGLRKLADGGGRSQARAVAIISFILLAAYLIAVWAMSAKPE